MFESQSIRATCSVTTEREVGMLPNCIMQFLFYKEDGIARAMSEIAEHENMF